MRILELEPLHQFEKSIALQNLNTIRAYFQSHRYFLVNQYSAKILAKIQKNVNYSSPYVKLTEQEGWRYFKTLIKEKRIFVAVEYLLSIFSIKLYFV